MEDDEESKEPKSNNIGSKLKPPSLTDIGINDQVDIKVGPAQKKPRAMLSLTIDDDLDEPKEKPRISQDPQGATGATGDVNLNSSSCASSEQSSAKKT